MNGTIGFQALCKHHCALGKLDSVPSFRCDFHENIQAIRRTWDVTETFQFSSQGDPMLWAVATAFFVAWVVGLTSTYAESGLIHVPLVIAIAVILAGVVMKRRTT